MKKKAQLREVSRLHREQRDIQQSSSANTYLPTAPSLKTAALNRSGGPSPNMADQIPPPISKKRPLQETGSPPSSGPMTEPTVKKQKTETSTDSLLSSDKNNNDVTQSISKVDSPSDGTSTEDEDLADPEEERQKEILWQAFSGRYAELTRLDAQKSSLGSEYSPREKSVASSMVEASDGAPESHQMSEKPSGSGDTATQSKSIMISILGLTPSDPIQRLHSVWSLPSSSRIPWAKSFLNIANDDVVSWH